jgi:hypothetical protein
VLLKAEAKIMAQAEAVGEAKSWLYPKITLQIPRGIVVKHKNKNLLKPQAENALTLNA